MSTALTKPRDTREVVGDLFRGTVAAGETIYAGALAAINATGYIVPASDTNGLRVIGRAEHSAAAGESVLLKRGVFMYGNEDGIADGNVGSYCFAANDQSVKKSGDCPAGLVRGVTADGVYVDTTLNPDGATAGATAGAAAIAADLESAESTIKAAALVQGAAAIAADLADGSSTIKAAATTIAGNAVAAAGNVRLVTAPAAANSTGVKGDIASDGTYLYLCIDTNEWVRVALALATW